MVLEAVDLDEYYETIESYGDVFDLQVLSEVAYEEASYPIYEINIEGSNEDKKKMLIVGVTHGNEFSSAFVVTELLKQIASGDRADLYDAWDLRILSPLNPVGLLYQSRYNELGCDINRDFKDFKTVGAQLKRDAILDFSPNIAVSLHEGPQDGFFAIATDAVNNELIEALAHAYEEKDVDTASHSFLGLPLSRGGVMDEAGLITAAKHLLGIHSFGRYGESKGVPVITTESDWAEQEIDKRIAPHLVTIETVLEEF